MATASRSISSPPARLIAPATPAPIHGWSLAALAIASKPSAAMSPSTTSSSSTRAVSLAADEERRLVRHAGEQAEVELVELVSRAGCGGEDAADAVAGESQRRDGEWRRFADDRDAGAAHRVDDLVVG